MSNGSGSRADGAVAGSSNTGSGVPGLERLVGRANWRTWKLATKTYLQLEKLWGAVKPKRKTDGTFEAVEEETDLRARLKIITLIDPSLYVHIENEESARTAWDSLENAFEEKGLVQQVGLLHKLLRLTLEACSSMEDYVNQVISATNQLRNADFNIPDLWVGMLLLAGLPKDFKPMIMALQSSGVAITGDFIKTKLLQEEEGFYGNEQNSPAFATTKQPGRHGKQKQQQPTSSKGPKCRKCQKFGHIAKDCKDNKEQKKGGSTFCTVLSTFDLGDADDWIFDSAAYAHMTANRSMLDNLDNGCGKVMAANGGLMDIVATGTAEIWPKCSGGKDSVTVSEVQLIPSIAANLLSVSKIVEKGYTVNFTNRGCEVFNSDGDLVATGSHVNNQFKLEKVCGSKVAMACGAAQGMDLWHKRLGHLGADNIRKLANGAADGIQINAKATKDCRICPMGKQARLPFGKNGSRASELLQLVHSDICGPMEVNSYGGNRYYITFIDDKSRRMFVYFLQRKSEDEVLAVFKTFHAMAERQTGMKLKTLRTDNGKEYINKGIQGYLRTAGIRHETTNDYTPEQNGMAERANRTIVEKSRCLLFEAKLPKGFWAEAVSTAVYLINRSPTRGHEMTPEEAWTGKKPNLSHLRVFGTKAMVQIPKQKRRKWDAKSHECILTGFDEETKGYRLYDPKQKKTLISREVIFLDEGIAERGEVAAQQVKPIPVVTLDVLDFGETRLQPAPAEPVPVEAVPDAPIDPRSDDEDEEEQSETDSSGESDSSTGTLTDLVLPPQQSSQPARSQLLRRSGREHALPGKYKDFSVKCPGLPGFNPPQAAASEDEFPGSSDDDYESADEHGFAAMAAGSGVDDPVTFQEALKRDDRDCWKRAMQEEFQALVDNNTWTLAELPRGRKAIKCKWVFKTKHDAEGRVQRHKARLVIKGYSQRKGVDFDETYAPVVRYSSLRYLFALAAKHDLAVDQMDAVTAFLQGDLDEEIYMEQPPCFTDGEQKSLVCKLNKALYGLKQSSRVWNQKLDAALKKFGLAPTKYDPCVYLSKSDGNILIVAIYVDDLMIFSNNSARTNKLKKQLSSHFRMKDLGAAKHCLGIRIERTEDGIALDQEAYIESVLKRFNMSECKPVSIPMNASEKLSNEMSPKTEAETALMKDVPYQEAVGCLMYLAQSTRPDILFAVNTLSRFNRNPGPKHWNAVKHLLRYLRGTATRRLEYKRDAESEIVGYCDADWGSDPDERKSTSGYIFLAQGGAISWSCKKQPTVALSTCEAEYMAVSAAVQEASWWRGISTLFGSNQPIEIRCDNQSCIAIAKNGGYNPRTKHIDIRHHYIRDSLEQGVVKLEYVSTDNQIADGLTKPLQRMKLDVNRSSMGISSSSGGVLQ